MASEESRADWYRQPLIRRVGVGLAFAATLAVGGCSNAEGRIEPSPEAHEAYKLPVEPTPTLLDLGGIFDEGSVGDEPLPVGELGSGVCANGETTKEDYPAYHIDTRAIESIVDAIRTATAGLDEAREAGASLTGTTPDGREVIVQFIFNLPPSAYDDPTYTQVSEVSMSDLLSINMSVKNVDESTTVAIFYREGRSNRLGEESADCVDPFWVGYSGNIAAEGPPVEDSELSQMEQLRRMAESASGATDFRPVDLGDASPEIIPDDVSPELDTTGIFLPGTVSNDPLTVIEGDGFACDIGETTRDGAPMYSVSTEAVGRLVAAIEKATEGLDQERERGDLIVGERRNLDGAPGSVKVYIQVGHRTIGANNGEGSQPVQISNSSDEDGKKTPDTIYLDVTKLDGSRDSGMFLFLEGAEQEGCEPHWVGHTYGVLGDGANDESTNFGLIASRAMGATNFRPDIEGSVDPLPTGPSIQLL